jgi:hypothetical protein
MAGVPCIVMGAGCVTALIETWSIMYSRHVAACWCRKYEHAHQLCIACDTCSIAHAAHHQQEHLTRHGTQEVVDLLTLSAMIIAVDQCTYGTYTRPYQWT